MAKTMDYFMGIVELAKAGYKPNDVKDLLELAKTTPEPEQSNATELSDSTESEKLKTESVDLDKAIDDIIKREKEV